MPLFSGRGSKAPVREERGSVTNTTRQRSGLLLWVNNEEQRVTNWELTLGKSDGCCVSGTSNTIGRSLGCRMFQRYAPFCEVKHTHTLVPLFGSCRDL